MEGPLLVLVVLMLKLLTVILPLALVGLGGWLLFKRSRMGRALEERVQSGADDAATVQELASHVAHLETQLAELQERVDFAERRLLEWAPQRLVTGEPRTPPEPVRAG